MQVGRNLHHDLDELNAMRSSAGNNGSQAAGIKTRWEGKKEAARPTGKDYATLH